MIPREKIVPILQLDGQINNIKRELHILELQKENMILNLHVDYSVPRGDTINADGSITPAQKLPDPELPIEEKNTDV
jgi:hypothetical protein